MKSLSKMTAISTGLLSLVFAVFSLSPVMADSPGQIEGGNIYRIKNITQNVDFTNNATANACDVLDYKVHLHNPGFGSITNVNVTMTLGGSGTTNTSTMTATYQKGVVPSTSATATVSLSSAQTINYVNGSTQLLDGNGNVIKTLPDTVTQSGVNIGDLNGSTTEYVNFEAKVNCPTPPANPTYACTDLTLVTEDNRTVKVSNFSTSVANGATYKNVVITWGDNNNVTIINPMGQTHQYGADGSYTIVATPHFMANGQEVTSTSQACSKTVTFSSSKPPTVTPPVTTVTPAAPTQLVNTGPGSVIGIFALASTAGTLLYRRILSRRLV